MNEKTVNTIQSISLKKFQKLGYRESQHDEKQFLVTILRRKLTKVLLCLHVQKLILISVISAKLNWNAVNVHHIQVH